tara:strand:+ start:28 stop:1212 length:1185 start_codon:yes stop_codon:yes gene_type:complete
MPLNDLFKKSKETIDKMTIKQLVTLAGGDERLSDDSDAQIEMRDFFTKIENEKLTQYSNMCLKEPFENSGLVLQDIVNEMGRRINFEVKNGLYQGSSKKLGFDGIWRTSDFDFVIETKTTSKFPINLERAEQIRLGLINDQTISPNSATLFVVGRQDTLNLEQQIRGSRYSWSMRIIGLESLIKLMGIYENSFSNEVEYKIREMLKPADYTRIDNIVEIVFTTSTDKTLSDEITIEDDTETNEGDQEKVNNRELHKIKRMEIADAFSKSKNTTILPRKTALFSNSDNSLKVAISISKRYNRSDQKYWFAYLEPMREFLSTDNSFMVFGLLDKNFAFVLPKKKIEELRPLLNTTPEKENRKEYWHVDFRERDDKIVMNLPKEKSFFELEPYKLSF